MMPEDRGVFYTVTLTVKLLPMLFIGFGPDDDASGVDAMAFEAAWDKLMVDLV